jgi:3-hydroxybutyrate dehydrogenase
MPAGKTAIVTGSTSGIGLGIATALAGSGTNIVLNGFGPADEIDKIVSDLKRQHNVGVMYSSANIADPDEIEEMVDQTRTEFGSVDILVNKAGIQHVDPIEEFPADKWNAIIAINLSGAFHTCRLTVPDMKKKGWGRIINVASAHALVASPFKSAYVSAKHGLAGLTKTVALELAEHGVTANAICPGYVLTPLVKKANSRAGQGPRHQRRGGDEGRAAGGTADQGVRRGFADRGARHLPLLGRSGLDHRRPVADRRWLDRALAPVRNGLPTTTGAHVTIQRHYAQRRYS